MRLRVLSTPYVYVGKKRSTGKQPLILVGVLRNVSKTLRGVFSLVFGHPMINFMQVFHVIDQTTGQTGERVFHHMSEHQEVCSKNKAQSSFFNALVWI